MLFLKNNYFKNIYKLLFGAGCCKAFVLFHCSSACVFIIIIVSVVKESGEALKRLQQQIHETEKRMIHDDILGDDMLATGHENISKIKGRHRNVPFMGNDGTLPLNRYKTQGDWVHDRWGWNTFR